MEQHVGLIHLLLIVQIRPLVFLPISFLLKIAQIEGLRTVGVVRYIQIVKPTEAILNVT